MLVGRDYPRGDKKEIARRSHNCKVRRIGGTPLMKVIRSYGRLLIGFTKIMEKAEGGINDGEVIPKLEAAVRPPKALSRLRPRYDEDMVDGYEAHAILNQGTLDLKLNPNSRHLQTGAPC